MMPQSLPSLQRIFQSVLPAEMVGVWAVSREESWLRLSIKPSSHRPTNSTPPSVLSKPLLEFTSSTYTNEKSDRRQQLKKKTVVKSSKQGPRGVRFPLMDCHEQHILSGWKSVKTSVDSLLLISQKRHALHASVGYTRTLFHGTGSPL